MRTQIESERQKWRKSTLEALPWNREKMELDEELYEQAADAYLYSCESRGVVPRQPCEEQSETIGGTLYLRDVDSEEIATIKSGYVKLTSEGLFWEEWESGICSLKEIDPAQVIDGFETPRDGNEYEDAVSPEVEKIYKDWNLEIGTEYSDEALVMWERKR